MSIEDGLPLTQQEQLALFAEKEATLFVMNILLFNWGEHPDRIHDVIDRAILDMKNSDGTTQNMAEHVWDEKAPLIIPALERVAAHVKSKLTAPRD